tara:strand:+ start:1955 stop:2668 length:714 start_codon:yes stop_codon:yes gene_type:complete
MTEDQRSESRVAGLLDSIDAASRKLELAIKEKRSKKSTDMPADGNIGLEGVETENTGEKDDLHAEGGSDSVVSVAEEESVEKDIPDLTESSYHKSPVEEPDSLMEQAPITKPRRPRRRSEYEMYEWVLLLANLIMWPTVIIISIILGSGDAIEGRSYNMEDNYLMLIGPLALTMFFFMMLYKMDSNARDGSLYAAEKQSYLDEMEKYLEARKAYLELVTIQADLKKQELIGVPSSEE